MKAETKDFVLMILVMVLLAFAVASSFAATSTIRENGIIKTKIAAIKSVVINLEQTSSALAIMDIIMDGKETNETEGN